MPSASSYGSTKVDAKGNTLVVNREVNLALESIKLEDTNAY